MPPARIPPRMLPVTAVLGPTNTGKTHLAVERMLASAGGMIGLPLRLLAREVYDKVRLRTGDHAVALVTGEEKIIPAHPRYWIATVEAMPPDLRVPFLAIDEIQIASDLERGHIFTDRILHMRGTEETMLLGAATMRPILAKLLPKTQFIARPRLSKLAYAGPRKLSRLPRRTAIVAFTADTVYTVAELIRRQRGGAAVVMGALSPRTRNAQVALYQSGDVDYLVATDAIGMGLNMDVDHVAFAATRKFDGFSFRNLTPGELGQIAGRAGRFLNDGTVGVTGEVEGFDGETVDRLENHNFESVRVLQWRNRDLDFRSLDTLRKSLGRLPQEEGLTRAQATPDIEALEAVCRDESLRNQISGHESVARAWDVCQLPDYRNISPAEHAHLVSRVLTFLQRKPGLIPEDWIARQLSYCENLEGNIDALSQRISHVRTWTFIANRADWLEAPLYWQGRAREIEDRLSDALHHKLTERFIDRKTSVLVRRLAKKEGLMSSVEEGGVISVEGEDIGRIAGLSFVPADILAGSDAKLLKAAAVQALMTEVAARATVLSTCADTVLKLARTGDILWQGHSVGKLVSGDHRFKPQVQVIADDILAPALREEVRQRLQKFVERQLITHIDPLLKLDEAEGLEGTVRGIAYRIAENFGVLPRELVTAEVKGLSQDDRAKLRALGVRFGAYTLYVPLLLKPAPTEIRLLLWWLEHHKGETGSDAIPALPANGLTSIVADAAMLEGYYQLCGYRLCGKRAVRVDMLERLADLVRDRLFWKPRIPEETRPQGSMENGGFTVVPDMMSVVGCSGEDFEAILTSLGYRAEKRMLPKPVHAKATPVVAIVEPAPEIVATDAVVEVTAETVADQPTEAVETISPAPSEEAAPSPENEMVETNIWWPDGMGPFRQRPKRPERQQHHKREHHAKNGANKHHKKKAHHDHGKSGEHRPHKPRAPERPIDPNSPFAVLSSLREALVKDRN
jgi:ATP-dependent RNA helicase SUPV3L1/SUV3